MKKKAGKALKQMEDQEDSVLMKIKTMLSLCNSLEGKSTKGKMCYALAAKSIEQKGKELFGERFLIHEQDKLILYKLISYFIGDIPIATQFGLDSTKGIMFTGPIGCGKTSLLNLCRYFQPQASRFILKSSREVSFEFIKDGYEIIHRYSRYNSLQAPRAYCFDDLGAENNLKYFGNECNVMAEVLLSRYDLYISGKALTHITTNLSASELEEIYGNRVRSRMREMFNLISFDKEVSDKRK